MSKVEPYKISELNKVSEIYNDEIEAARAFLKYYTNKGLQVTPKGVKLKGYLNKETKEIENWVTIYIPKFRLNTPKGLTSRETVNYAYKVFGIDQKATEQESVPRFSFRKVNEELGQRFPNIEVIIRNDIENYKDGWIDEEYIDTYCIVVSFRSTSGHTHPGSIIHKETQTYFRTWGDACDFFKLDPSNFYQTMNKEAERRTLENFDIEVKFGERTFIIVVGGYNPEFD